MPELTYDMLREAVAGGSVALRSILRLQPVDGPGGKVFPPTYDVKDSAEHKAEHKYAVEERQLGDRVSVTVLLDSVASQANRAELALREGWEAGELTFPVPYVDFRGGELSDLGRITVLDAPHRLTDAIFRDSLLEETEFRRSDVGRAITDARPGNATAMFRYAPTTLLFGGWDSTGHRGGRGYKFQRAYVSEIVGLDAKIGVKVKSRLDPLQIKKDAADIYVLKDSKEMWTLDKADAEVVKRKSQSKKVVVKKGKPSSVNHSNVPPSIDAKAGGVTISEARQTTVISLAALRRLRFAGYSRNAQTAARTAVAALGVAAVVNAYEADLDLRSRCLLIPQHAPAIEMVGRSGSAPDTVDIDRDAAAALVSQADAGAREAGIGWEQRTISLSPAPKLVELIKRSRDV